MTRARLRNHLLAVGGVLVIGGLLGVHLGVNEGTWWLLGAVIAVLHLGAFSALIAWIVRRVRRHRADARQERNAEPGQGRGTSAA